MTKNIASMSASHNLLVAALRSYEADKVYQILYELCNVPSLLRKDPAY